VEEKKKLLHVAINIANSNFYDTFEKIPNKASLSKEALEKLMVFYLNTTPNQTDINKMVSPEGTFSVEYYKNAPVDLYHDNLTLFNKQQANGWPLIETLILHISIPTETLLKRGMAANVSFRKLPKLNSASLGEGEVADLKRILKDF